MKFLVKTLLLIVFATSLIACDGNSRPTRKQIQKMEQIAREIFSEQAPAPVVSEEPATTEEKSAPEVAEESSEITALEIPVLDTDTPEELIPHVGYTVSHNYRTRIPNWVAWELTAHEAQGDVPRADGFVPDPMCKSAQAGDHDYRNSGYDRGHMAPAGDMKWSGQAMDESFYFTNVCPQNRNLNRGDWKDLEEKCRALASRYDQVWIACGPIVGDAQQGRIGTNRVVVPDAFFKVLLIHYKGKYHGIGFYFENAAGSRNLSYYAHTIDEIEQLTGIDFYPALPDEVETQVEASKDLAIWQLN